METAEQRRKRVNQRFREVFSSDEGVIVLEELSRFCHMGNGEFVADPRKLDYLQGRRSVVCEILRILNEKEDE